MPMIWVPCACCGSEKKRSVWPKHNNLVRCLDCGFVYVSPRLSKEEINLAYAAAPLWSQTGVGVSEENDVFYNSGALRVWERDQSYRFRKRVENILDEIERYIAKARLLDVGSSNGLQLMVARERGWDVAGVEICQAAAEFTRKELGLDVRGQELGRADFDEASFDCVIMSHVLEHAFDPGEMCRDVGYVLRPGGLLYVAVPNITALTARLTGPYWHFVVPEHLSFFSAKTLVNLLENNGFEPIQVHTQYIRTNAYFYFGMAKRLKIDKLFASLLGITSEQWKTAEQETATGVTVTPCSCYGLSKKKQAIEKIIKIVNKVWPKKALAKAGLGEEVIVIAKRV